MEKIKNLDKVILPEGTVLAEIKKLKRYIVLPDGTKDEDSYGIIITIHPSVKDLFVGDIVIKYGGSLYGYTIGEGSTERAFAIMNRGNINIAVRPDNFIDPGKLAEKLSV
jgi:hypothetical protein